MKKIVNVVMLLLAMNFLAVVGGVAYLKQSGKLDHDKVMAIKEIVFPSSQPTTAPAEDPSTQPADAVDPTTQPMARLEDLLAQQLGRPATEQVAFMRQTFDAQMVQLERKQRELADLRKQIELAKNQMVRDRSTFSDEKKSFDDREQEAAKLATDQGFQDSLAMYKSMNGKQVKTIFMGLDDKTVSQYLQAMDPRASARIIKEFKSPQETAFVEKVLERIRKAQDAQPSPTTSPAEASAGSKE